MPQRQPVPAVSRLVAGLPPRDRARLLAACELVDLVLHTVLHEPGDHIRHVYFPVEGFVSLVTPVIDATCIEVALIGNEGMCGASLALGTDVAPLHSLVQGRGTAWRINASAFTRQLARSAPLRRQLQHYIYVQMCQLAQSAACSRFHLVEARLARWLLMTHDRAHSDLFHITHAYLAWMLGVRRPGITTAATALQKRNLINYRRGDITVLDRKGLEAAACVCYKADQRVYEKILGRPA